MSLEQDIDLGLDGAILVDSHTDCRAISPVSTFEPSVLSPAILAIVMVRCARLLLDHEPPGS